VGSYHEVSGDHPLLEEFAMGEWVLYAQTLLKKEGFEPADHKLDGLFGPNTALAVRDFQDSRHLALVDARIGPETWAALEGRLTVVELDIGPGRLVFDQMPEIDHRGFLVWTVKAVGSTAVPANTSSGNYEITSSNSTYPAGDTVLAAGLAPDQVSPPIGVELNGYPDGDYQISVQVSNHVEYVNFRVVGGVAEPR
jgi:hypothetical protein